MRGERDVVPDHGEMAHQESSQAFERIGGLGAGAAHVLLEAVADVLEDGTDHVVLALEVALQRGGHEADPPGEAGDAQTPHAVAPDEAERGLDDLLAADKGTELLGGHLSEH
jgi:hypothetical protein